MDLNLLVALDALLSERNVSRAAIRLFRSQSAMSGALARLRDHFQDELLVPLGRKMVLTSFAASLRSPLSALMDQIGRTVDLSAKFDPPSSDRRFSICANDQMIEVVFPELIRDLSVRAPGVQLEIFSVALSAEEMIENGQVQLLLADENTASRLFPSEFLFADDYVVLGWIENPIFQQPISFDDLFSLRRIASRTGPKRILAPAELQMQAVDKGKGVDIYTPSTMTMPKLLIGTKRIAVVTRSMAQVFSSTLPLTYLPSPVELQPVRIVMQAHPARDSDVGLSWLKSRVREVLAARGAITSLDPYLD
jgi:DNA-binding transcriptional LysR family regulator